MRVDDKTAWMELDPRIRTPEWGNVDLMVVLRKMLITSPTTLLYTY
jgi:hypothetical protein